MAPSSRATREASQAIEQCATILAEPSYSLSVWACAWAHTHRYARATRWPTAALSSTEPPSGAGMLPAREG